MARAGQRKCLCCGHFFNPDHRNRSRQRYCSATQCQRASKALSQTKWLADPANANYHSDPVHVARVQVWRAAHPGYARGRSRNADALQDSLISQPIESIDESSIHTPSALQDLLNVPSPVLAGLIAHLFEVTLQEDMAPTTLRLVQLGEDMMKGKPREERQTSVAAGEAA